MIFCVSKSIGTPFFTARPDRHSAIGGGRRLLCCLGLLLSLGVSSADAQEFVIEDIRIDGLQRVSAGLVFERLPFGPGDPVSSSQLREVIRDLFATGNFDDVKIARDDAVLIIKVTERPFISEIELEGNKALKSEDLLEGLSNAGLASGQVLKRATLVGIRGELLRQYTSRGRYDAEVLTEVTEQPRNRVAIRLKIDEGTPARIREINIIGNSVFPPDELLKVFESRAAGRFAFFSKRSQYSRETFGNDLEKLSSHYRDRGYLQFVLESVQVSVAADKKAIFIDISIAEGEPFTIGKISFSGELPLPEQLFARSIRIEAGAHYSEVAVKNAEEIITALINNVGYLDAEVRSFPDVDEDAHTVDLRFFVLPNARTYVRRIEFSGNSGTTDAVLRREMRQLESAPASRAAIDQSRVRLERLGFFKEVEIDTEPVPGSPDEVDVQVSVEEEFSGSLVLSIGYNQTYGAIFRFGLDRRNFLGTGNSVNLQVQSDRASELVSVSLTEPYFTAGGVSRSINLYYRDIDLDEVNITRYATKRVGGGLTFGYPIGNTARISAGLSYDQTQIYPGLGPVQEIIGSPLLFDEDLVRRQVMSEDMLLGFEQLSESPLLTPPTGFLDIHGDQFESLSLTLGWQLFRLNRGQLATGGSAHNLSVQFVLPGSDLEYYKINYRYETFWQLNDTFKLRAQLRLGYGDSYGEGDGLPFFEHYFTGGLGSIRGYEGNTLGPRSTPALQYQTADNDDDVDDTPDLIYILGEDGRLQTRQVFSLDEPDPFGGNLLTVLNFELLFPLPFLEDTRSVRSGFFLDIGNVFNTNCGAGQTRCSDFKASELRSSVGFNIVWITALGPLNFTLAYPLNEKSGDETRNFDFSIGRGLGL